MFRNKLAKIYASPLNWRCSLSPLAVLYSTQARIPLFDKILIANRGEIAVRIMKTAKKLGIKTVAVYSQADSKALHVKMADEAYCIGPAPSSLSYLNKGKILEIAKLSGAKGVHPGYGFLSENADFAEHLEDNQISFIGPPPSAIRSMGSKSTSKEIMEMANVPVVPGYHGDNQDPTFLKEEAGKIGYPVLIKAVLGGGGKGMRIVESESEFNENLEAAKREAMKSFSDDNVLIEKYITDPRHVEVQVFADKLGNAVYLFERDCSIQRRHQKILEESPAPHLTEETRKILGEKAVAAAKAVHYVGAGTVEFIMDSKTHEFFFMEMNTRLQVEHPVTEMVTGTDLVEWQLEVAAGNKIPQDQDEITKTGHAFEARIYAENPDNEFLPDTGRLVYMSTPETNSNIRVETGIRQGDEISVNYDPMIAKLVVHSKDRISALQILDKALSEFKISGLHTNIEFLRKVISIPDLAAGNVETGFIKKHQKALFENRSQTKKESVIQGAFGLYFKSISPNLGNGLSNAESSSRPEVFSTWSINDSFRIWNVSTPSYNAKVESQNKVYNVEILPEPAQPGHFKVILSNESDNTTTNSELIVFESKVLNSSSLDATQIQLRAEIDNCMFESTLIMQKDKLTIFGSDDKTEMSFIDKNEEIVKSFSPEDKAGSIKAPMSSNIVQILVKPGQEVDIGTHLVILEAMKMEHVIKSPKKGVIESVKFSIGDLVAQGQELVSFADEE